MSMIAAECPSACSGHGTCGAYDACKCFRNWMANDCSERICPFGSAHVDTPLGDLDSSSGKLTGPNVNVIVNDAMYPQGTPEQFPAMKDSGGTQTAQSAHYYRECSNKGICDRSKGECECFDGYDGNACQRASCPTSGDGVCSGHGTCQTIQELASYDAENIYRLWDEDVTMGCKCDAGYTGADCSSRSCKFGNDPLYYDDFQNVRHANFTVQFYVLDNAAEIYGNYSLIFTDIHGEDWQTDPIDIDANCGVIQDRLESLPNNVVPTGSVLCYKHEGTADDATLLHVATGDANVGQIPNVGGRRLAAGDGTTAHTPTGQYTTQFDDDMYDNRFFVVNKFTLAFPGNPGDIPPLKVNRYLDGKRPTLFTTERGTQTLGVHVFSNGFHGEKTDYVNDECEGVLVTLKTDDVGTKWQQYLGIANDLEFERLKKCLGDADGLSHNNVEVYDWDYGSFMNPHLIKLVDATQDRFVEYIRADGSSYKVLSIDGSVTPAGGGSAADWDAVPVTRLCSNNKAHWFNDNYLTGAANKFPLEWQNVDKDGAAQPSWKVGQNLGTRGWCRNYNPPGFFAIVYFDDCSANGVSTLTTASGNTMCSDARKGFRLMTRPATDYHTTTKFHVYTTKGTLQQVSQHSAAYTTTDLADTDQFDDMWGISKVRDILLPTLTDSSNDMTVTAVGAVCAATDSGGAGSIDAVFDVVISAGIKSGYQDGAGSPVDHNVQITTGHATAGTYTGVALQGGTGSGAIATITVTGIEITSLDITTGGTGYATGDVLIIPANFDLKGASARKFTVIAAAHDTTAGQIESGTSDGTDPHVDQVSAYVTEVAGTYTGIALTGGSGTGAVATITVANNDITKLDITSEGSGYLLNDILTIPANFDGHGATARYFIPVADSFGNRRVEHITTTLTGAGYAAGDVITLTCGTAMTFALTGTEIYNSAAEMAAIHDLHSNVVHVTSTTFEGAQGQIDCETAPVGTYDNLDCLNKGDHIFLVNLGARDDTKCQSALSYTNLAGHTVDGSDSCFYQSSLASFNSNPLYPNMYTVKKIGKTAKDGNAAVGLAAGSSGDVNPTDPDEEGYRHVIHLDMGVNVRHLNGNNPLAESVTASKQGVDTKATIYKFYPPTLATTKSTGYTYVAECSNRGLCDSSSGICECFTGYTGQACEEINSLAM